MHSKTSIHNIGMCQYHLFFYPNQGPLPTPSCSIYPKVFCPQCRSVTVPLFAIHALVLIDPLHFLYPTRTFPIYTNVLISHLTFYKRCQFTRTFPIYNNCLISHHHLLSRSNVSSLHERFLHSLHRPYFTLALAPLNKGPVHTNLSIHAPPFMVTRHCCCCRRHFCPQLFAVLLSAGHSHNGPSTFSRPAFPLCLSLIV